MASPFKHAAPHRMSLEEIAAVKEAQKAFDEGRFMTLAQLRKRVARMIARGPRRKAKASSLA